MWQQRRLVVLNAAGWRCSCGGIASEVHHVMPVSEGGGDDWDNLRPLCQACHKAETNRQRGVTPIGPAWARALEELR